VRSQFKTKDGVTHDHESALLRRAWKENGKVHRHTVASLTHRPAAEIDALELVLNKGWRPDGPRLAAPEATKSSKVKDVALGPGRTHGGVAAVLGAADAIGLPGMLGPPGRNRDLVMGLIAARLCHPASKVAQSAWWAQTTLGEDYGLGEPGKDEAFRAMDWLAARKDTIEQALAAKYLADPDANPAKLVLYDLTSTWMEGTKCELAAFGHSRDNKKGRSQIEFALIAAPSGVPVGLRVFGGDTSDPIACKQAISAIAEQFAMDQAVLVGDRGMVTGTRIDDLKKTPGLGWIGALRRSSIAALAADNGPLQMTLFDQTDLFDFTDPRFPGELLVACRNPFRADGDKVKREKLITATLADLDKVATRVAKGNLVGAGAINRAVGQVINKRKVGRLVTVDVARAHISIGRNAAAIDAEAMLDGVYVIRTSLGKDQLAPAAVLTAYKQLKEVEKDFKWIKSTDIAVRPVRHWKVARVEAHLLICMLAAVLEHHLRAAWAPLTFTDEHPGPPPTPSKPARRSAHADAKAAKRHREDGLDLRSFGELLDHLGAMTRNTITIATPAGEQSFVEVTRPTKVQAEAFRLLGAKIPKVLRKVTESRAASAA